MSKEQNVATQGLGGEIAATREFDRFGEVFADGVVDHDAAEDQASGVEGIKQYWRGVSEHSQTSSSTLTYFSQTRIGVGAL